MPDSPDSSWFRATGSGLALHLRVTPNAAAIALLAKALGLPKSALILTSGETSRFKTVTINGNSEALSRLLAGISHAKRP